MGHENFSDSGLSYYLKITEADRGQDSHAGDQGSNPDQAKF